MLPLDSMRAARLLPAAIAAIAVPAALWGGALIGQFGFGLVPCQMCYWQRWPHEVALVLGLFSLPLLSRDIGRIVLVLAAIAIAVSGAIGVFHAGVEYKWWDGLTSCSADAGGFDIMKGTLAPIVRCDQAQWRLAGISLAGFNAIFSFMGALIVLALLRRASRGG